MNTGHMKTTLRTLLSAAIVCLYSTLWIGCNQKTSTTPSGDQTAHNESAHDHAGEDDHDHDHDHVHPEHGKRGGHIVKLSNDAETEVQLVDESDLFTVYIDGLGDVSKVQMKTKIADKETVYEFERSDTPEGAVYGLKSPELATAVKMGKDVVQTELTITTAEGDLRAQYEHHSH